MPSEMADWRRDVIVALAQSRNHDREDVQSVVKVAAEAAVGHHPGQVSVCGRHQAHVHLDGPGVAQVFELLFLATRRATWAVTPAGCRLPRRGRVFPGASVLTEFLALLQKGSFLPVTNRQPGVLRWGIISTALGVLHHG
jgi:hypothetical protein